MVKNGCGQIRAYTVYFISTQPIMFGGAEMLRINNNVRVKQVEVRKVIPLAVVLLMVQS